MCRKDEGWKEAKINQKVGSNKSSAGEQTLGLETAQGLPFSRSRVQFLAPAWKLVTACTSSSWDLMSSFGFHGHVMHTFRQKTYTHKIKSKKKKKGFVNLRVFV